MTARPPFPITPGDLGELELPGSRTDTLLQKVTLYRRWPHLLLFDVIKTLFGLRERCPNEAMLWILDRAMHELEPAGPFDEIGKGDAEFWVDLASPRELKAYFIAITKRLGRDKRLLNNRALKQLMVSIWAELPEEDRRAFLSKVDPTGRFQK